MLDLMFFLSLDGVSRRILGSHPPILFSSVGNLFCSMLPVRSSTYGMWMGQVARRRHLNPWPHLVGPLTMEIH